MQWTSTRYACPGRRAPGKEYGCGRRVYIILFFCYKSIVSTLLLAPLSTVSSFLIPHPFAISLREGNATLVSRFSLQQRKQYTAMSLGFSPYSNMQLSAMKKFFRLSAIPLSFFVVVFILHYNINVFSRGLYKIIGLILDNYNEMWYTVCVIKFGGILYERNRRADQKI